MENNKERNEELQSRREFFKKTAKAVLPIVGAIVLSSASTILKAEEPRMGCYNDCTSSCRGGCMGCTGTCTGGCQGYCGGNCYMSCSGRCNTGCAGTCSTMCKSGGSYSPY